MVRTPFESAQHWLMGQPTIVVLLVGLLVAVGYYVPAELDKIREEAKLMRAEHREERKEMAGIYEKQLQSVTDAYKAESLASDRRTDRVIEAHERWFRSLSERMERRGVARNGAAAGMDDGRTVEGGP